MGRAFGIGLFIFLAVFFFACNSDQKKKDAGVSTISGPPSSSIESPVKPIEDVSTIDVERSSLAVVKDQASLDELQSQFRQMLTRRPASSKDDGFRLFNDSQPDVPRCFGLTSKQLSLTVGADVTYYSPGKVIENSYEDRVWKTDLDKWKEWIDSVPLGEAETTPYTGWGQSEGLTKVEARMIGKHKYIIRNSYEYFSGSWKRDYMAFVEDSSMIIDIMLFFYPDKKAIVLVPVEGVKDEYKYTVFGESFIVQFEKLLTQL